MIDPKDGRLIRLVDVPALAWLPKRRGGARLSMTTLYDWARKGLRGVTLETVSVGDTKCTTEAALMRFFERLNDPTPKQAAVTPAQQRRAQDRAKTILDRAGI